MGTFNGYVKQCRVRNVLCSQNQLIEYSLEEKLNIRIRNFYSEKQNMKGLAPYSQQSFALYAREKWLHFSPSSYLMSVFNN